MLGRALSLATVTLLIGCFAADPAPGQAQNLEAGKSPSQIFAGTCTACHKSPRGLLKTVPAGSLQGFLKQHYTTSPEMASLLAAFLVSNGAADTRYVGNQGKPGKDEKPEAKPGSAPEQLDRFGRRLRTSPAQEAAGPQVKPEAKPEVKPEAEPREAAKPDADGVEPTGRRGRNARRIPRPGESPAAEGQVPDQAASERGPDGRKLSAKQKLGKRGKPAGEEPKPESAKSESAKPDSNKAESNKVESDKTESKTESGKEEPAKSEAAKQETPRNDAVTGDTSKDTAKSEGGKPPVEGKPESGGIDTPKEKEAGSKEPPALRPDPVPPVTPAPAPSSTASVAGSGGAAEPSTPPQAQSAPPAAVTEPASPTSPAGPPLPPISK